jgi:hypothetical protein
MMGEVMTYTRVGFKTLRAWDADRNFRDIDIKEVERRLAEMEAFNQQLIDEGDELTPPLPAESLRNDLEILFNRLGKEHAAKIITTPVGTIVVVPGGGMIPGEMRGKWLAVDPGENTRARNHKIVDNTVDELELDIESEDQGPGGVTLMEPEDDPPQGAIARDARRVAFYGVIDQALHRPV